MLSNGNNLAQYNSDQVQAQQGNVYHNTYYGNDALAAELEKMQQNLRHQSELLKQQEAILAQKDTEIALLKEMLALLKAKQD